MAKRAVVIIHGVGQHQPYQTARAFADGIAQIGEARNPGVRSRVGQVIPRGPTQAGSQALPGRVYRIRPTADDDAFVDVYEAYWAPLVAGMTHFLGIVWWLFANTFIPSRLVRWPSSKWWYDLAFASGFLIITGGLYYWLLGALLQTTDDMLKFIDSRSPPLPTMPLSFDLSQSVVVSSENFRHLLLDSWNAPVRLQLGRASLANLSSVLSPVTLGWLFATVVAVYALLQFIFRLFELVRNQEGPLRDLLILAAFGLMYLLATTLVVKEFFAYGLIYVAFRLVNLWVKKQFVDGIGDIEVYVTRDSKSARFLARENIRSRAVDAVKAALMSTEGYAEVLVFGHSLGSVIGLDALRELRRQAGRTTLTEKQFNLLTSFVTFGSPLDKTRFFFDRISPDDTGRWRDFLEEIQTVFKGDADTPDAAPRRINWTNFWYFTDVIANSLDSYNGAGMPDLVWPCKLSVAKRTWWMRLWPHSEYVVDDQFLNPVYDRLFSVPRPDRRDAILVR